MKRLVLAASFGGALALAAPYLYLAIHTGNFAWFLFILPHWWTNYILGWGTADWLDDRGLL